MISSTVLTNLKSMNNMLNAGQVAALFGVQPTMIYNLAAKPAPLGLPCFRFGRLLKFEPGVLAAWIEEHAMGNVTLLHAIPQNEVVANLPAPPSPEPSGPVLIDVTEQIINGRTVEQTVNARELHRFLGSQAQFATWMTERIEQCKLLENEHFRVFHQTVKNPLGGRPAKDYIITLNTAKHLCLLEKTAKGEEIRQYFIDCENRINTPAPQLPPPAAPDAEIMSMLEFFRRDADRLRQINAQLNYEVGVMDGRMAEIDRVRRYGRPGQTGRLQGMPKARACEQVLVENGGSLELGKMIEELRAAGATLGKYPLRNILIAIASPSKRGRFFVSLNAAAEQIVSLVPPETEVGTIQ